MQINLKLHKQFDTPSPQKRRDFSAERKVACLHSALNKKFDIFALLNTKGQEIKKTQCAVFQQYHHFWTADMGVENVEDIDYTE